MVLCQVNECETVTPNKKFKPDYQRAAESALKWFSDYGALLSMALCVGSSLIRRYATQVNLGVQSFGISPAIRSVLSANEHFYPQIRG